MGKDINPLITVLMPVYNGQQYLAEAISSILLQTYNDFELLIIDDGSSDNSEKIINVFNDSRIVYIKNETNRGLIYSLNKGLRLAKGKYIARMDADDVSISERFEKQILEFKKDENLVICGSFIKTFGNGAEEYISHIPVTNAQIFSSIFFACPFAHPSVMIKKESLLLLNELYREDYKHSEDYDLWSRLLTLGKGINIPLYLLNYRIHDNQISYINQVQKYITVKKIQKNILAQLSLFPNEMETLFMLNFFKGISKQDQKYLNIGGHFLNKLNEQFKLKNPLYTNDFTKILISRWFQICGNSGLGLRNLKLAFNTPFFELKYLNFKDFLKLLYKSIINYKQIDLN